MEIAEGSYRFGAGQGQLLLHTSRTGLGRRAGHDLTIEATRWSGRAEVGREQQASVTVATDGLRVREGHGGLKPLTERDRGEIVRTMRGEKLLSADAHPTITFRTTSVGRSPDGFLLVGELTVAGTTRPLTVTGTVSADGRVRGETTLLQSQWGIRPYSAFLGALKLADEIRIEFDTTLVPDNELAPEAS